MTVFFTYEILGACLELLKSGMTFTPVIVQRQDLMYWPDGAVSTKVPAIFIKAVEVPISVDHHGEDVLTVTRVRCVVVDSFDPTAHDVEQRKINRAEDVADRFLEGTFDIGGNTIHANYELHHAVPVQLELEPPEDSLVSLAKERDLFAVAVTVDVTGRAFR